MDVGKLNSYFGEGTVLKGALRFKGLLRFDGQFEGEIHSKDTFIVGKPGKVAATINTGNLFNFGVVVGNVEAEKKISLHAFSQLKGNIRTPILMAEEKSYFEGGCSMPPLPLDEKQATDQSAGLLDAPTLPPGDISREMSMQEDIFGERKKSGGGVLSKLILIAILVGGGWYVIDNGLIELPKSVNQGKTAPAPQTTSPKQVEGELNENRTPSETESKPDNNAVLTSEEKAAQLAGEIKQSPGNPELRLNLANLYLGEKKYTEALTSLKESVTALPDSSDLLLLYANTLNATGREKDASVWYKEYTSLNPDTDDAKTNEGYAMLDRGALSKAEVVFNEVLSSRPEDNRARLGLATVYSKRDMNEKAAEECQIILEKTDDYAPALNRIAWVLTKQGEKLQEAKMYSEKSLAVFGDIPEYIDTLSEVHYRLNNFDDAITLIEKAISLAPDDKYYRRQLFKFKRAKSAN